ncbi:MAG: cytochrome b N-terminal domain-containing protein [bacterium]
MKASKICTRRIHDSPNVQEGQANGPDNGPDSVLHEGTGALSPIPKLQEYLEPGPVRWSSCSGWIIFYLFCLEGLSGILLLLYYRPTVSEAYESVQQITNILHYGWLVRGVHIWGIHLLVIFLMLHLAQKIITQSYGAALKLTWVLGILLMVLVGIIGATGHLLPWTQGSYWATTFLTQLSTAIPVIGESVKILIRGGSEVSQMTLSRFFALHILIAPFLFTLLAGLHIFSARRSLIPKDLLLQVLMLLVLTAMVFSLSTFSPPRISTKADPLNSILNIKPEWYFMASYETFQLLRIMHPEKQAVSVILGIVLHLGVLLLLLLFPWFAPSQDKAPWLKSLACALTTFGLLIFLTLTLLGACS